MNNPTQPTPPRTTEQPGAVITASALLSQWNDVATRRREEVDRRMNNWMLPAPGIEEALALVREDMNATMWFVDKTLKLLAAHEEAQKPATQPSPLAPGASERGTTG